MPLDKYVKLKSVTWWACLTLIGLQVARLVGVAVPGEADKILAGLIAIGLRGAIR